MSSPKTLLKAVTAGRTRQVRLLLDLGSSTEEQDDCGQTPLIRAVFVEHDRNREKILRMLLKKGALVSRADVVGRTALAWACLYGRDKDVALLLDYADVDIDYNKMDINGQTALFHAVSSGNAATVKLVVQALIKYDLSVDVPDYNGLTALMHATRLGHDVCASILIHNGHARAGLGQMNCENFIKKEKWAVSSLRERSKVKNARQKRSQFPPISKYNDESKDIRTRRIGVRQRRHQKGEVSGSDLDSDSSSDEDDSSVSSKGQHLVTTPRINDSNQSLSSSVWSCLQNLPPCRIPPSILASPTCSTLGNVSSGEESEVDSVASTIIEGKTRSGMDLMSMFNCKQDQMTTSFRQHAVSVIEPEPQPELPETPETPSVKNDKLKGRRESVKWQHLKKSLRLAGLITPGKPKPEVKVEDSKQTGLKLQIEIKKPSALPNIAERNPSLNGSPRASLTKQQAVRKNTDPDFNRNYSEI